MPPESLGTYYESLLETEVRKEGGIYYTPPLIADYMVAESVGKLLKNKTLKEAERIKIVVPSCGDDFLLPDWQKELSIVFQQGGLDIIIGNPPYVESRSASVPTETKALYQNQVKAAFGNLSKYIPQGSDLFVYFFRVPSRY